MPGSQPGGTGSTPVWGTLESNMKDEETRDLVVERIIANSRPLTTPNFALVYDDASRDRIITKRLIVLMKKALRSIGDEPAKLYFDGAQYFDIPGQDGAPDKEDFPDCHLKELGIPSYDLITRKNWFFVGTDDETQSPKNNFCILEGVNGKIVIGAY